MITHAVFTVAKTMKQAKSLMVMMKSGAKGGQQRRADTRALLETGEVISPNIHIGFGWYEGKENIYCF